MKTVICINYDSKTILIEDEKDLCIEIPVKKQPCGGKTIFKNGASLYLGLLEVLLSEMYPARRGKTLSFDKFPSTEPISKFVSDLNCVLPDFLKIKGTSSLAFNSGINSRIISVSVIASKKASKEDRMRFGDRLTTINWDRKNQEVLEYFSDKSGSVQNFNADDDLEWNDAALKDAFIDYMRGSFDKRLLTPIVPYEVNLYDYIMRNFLPHSTHKICIIEGEGGAGKTTSIRYAADKLTSDGHKAIIVYANQLQITEQTICSYIADKYIRNIRNKRRETVIDLIKGASHDHKVFIFVDGVDELPSKYYRELIGDDVNALSSIVTENLYFVFTTRQWKVLIDLCDLDGRSIVAFAGMVDLNALELSDSYKALLVNYPQFRTPLFISMIKNIINMSEGGENGALSDYSRSEAARILNKTQLFDTWMELRTSHAAELGVKPYYYTHLLTLTAYESLKKYIRNGDRTIPREFFDVENISQLLEKLGGGAGRSIDVGFSTDRLIKVFLGTGLLVTSDNRTYMFSNLEYLLYLAGYFVSLLFIHESKKRRLTRIEFLTDISIEKTNPNIALASYPEFAFNRIMDAVRSMECSIDDDQRRALLRLGLAIGYEKVRDVDENVKVLMDWFMKHCKYDADSARIALRFTGPLYNMITKWKTDPQNAESRLSYIRSRYDWQEKYLVCYEEEHKDGYSLPKDFRASILGNKGAVEQEYAKYLHSEYSQDRSENSGIIQTHLLNALNFHNEAYLLRRSILKSYGTTLILTGFARNIIGMSTDLYYMASYNESLDAGTKIDYLLAGLHGGKGPNGIEIPGYEAALSLQGRYDSENFSWKHGRKFELRECEPCLIFRRMAGNCISLYDIAGAECRGTDVIKSLFNYLMLAATDLRMSCIEEDEYSESRLELFRPEINDFVREINDKFLGLIKEQAGHYDIEDVMDKMEIVLKVYNTLHHTNVKLDRQRYKLRNY